MATASHDFSCHVCDAKFQKKRFHVRSVDFCTRKCLLKYQIQLAAAAAAAAANTDSGKKKSTRFVNINGHGGAY